MIVIKLAVKIGLIHFTIFESLIWIDFEHLLSLSFTRISFFGLTERPAPQSLSFFSIILSLLRPIFACTYSRRLLALCTLLLLEHILEQTGVHSWVVGGGLFSSSVLSCQKCTADFFASDVVAEKRGKMRHLFSCCFWPVICVSFFPFAGHFVLRARLIECTLKEERQICWNKGAAGGWWLPLLSTSAADPSFFWVKKEWNTQEHERHLLLLTMCVCVNKQVSPILTESQVDRIKEKERIALIYTNSICHLLIWHGKDTRILGWPFVRQSTDRFLLFFPLCYFCTKKWHHESISSAQAFTILTFPWPNLVQCRHLARSLNVVHLFWPSLSGDWLSTDITL